MNDVDQFIALLPKRKYQHGGLIGCISRKYDGETITLAEITAIVDGNKQVSWQDAADAGCGNDDGYYVMFMPKGGKTEGELLMVMFSNDQNMIEMCNL